MEASYYITDSGDLWFNYPYAVWSSETGRFNRPYMFLWKVVYREETEDNREEI